MWLFGKKKEENVSISFEKRLKACENDILSLVADNEVMRNNVLRKLQTRKPKQEEQPQITVKPGGGIITPEEARAFKNES